MKPKLTSVLISACCLLASYSSYGQLKLSARVGAFVVMPENIGYSTAYNFTGNFGLQFSMNSYFLEYHTYNVFYSFTSVLKNNQTNTVEVEGQRWFGTAHNIRLGRSFEFERLIFQYSATFAFVSNDLYSYSRLPQIDSEHRTAKLNFLSAEFQIKIPLIYDSYFYFGGGPHYMVDWNNGEFYSTTFFLGLTYDFTLNK